MAHPDPRFIPLVHKLMEHGIEHARAVQLAREALPMEHPRDPQPDALAKRIGRASEPKRAFRE